MSDYTTLSAVKTAMNLGSQTTFDADINAAIPAASRAIDNLSGRRFYADATDQIYYYTPIRVNRLELDDYDSITTVAVDFNADGTFEQTWVANTEYVAYPLNRVTPYRPITRIETHPLSARFFPIGYPRTVQITGKQGWGTTPDAITEATTLLTIALVKRIREAPFGVLGFADTAIRISRQDPQFSLLVAPYRKLV